MQPFLNSKGDQLKAQAIQWVPRLKSFELIAEQLMNYLLPQAGVKKHMLVLMCFEMAIAFFRLKSLFSGTETLLMEEKLYAYFLADAKRRELIRQRTKNIWGLLQLHSNKTEAAPPKPAQSNGIDAQKPVEAQSNGQSAATEPTGPTDEPESLITRVHRVLGLKVKVNKPKPETAEDTEEPKPETPAVDPEFTQTPAEGPQVQPESANNQQVAIRDSRAAVSPANDRAPPAAELVADKEWQFENYKFNEDQLVKLPRKKEYVALLQSLPIPDRLTRSGTMPSWVKASEVLHILRPLFHCLLISLNEPGSFKPIIVSGLIDFGNLIMKQLYRPRSIPEIEEIKYRKRNLLYFYMLRKPIYTTFFRPKILEPLLKRLVRYDTIANFLLQSLDYASSYSLVM